jgi:hypothetical protein
VPLVDASRYAVRVKINMAESWRKRRSCKGDGDCDVGKEYDLYDLDNTKLSLLE